MNNKYLLILTALMAAVILIIFFLFFIRNDKDREFSESIRTIDKSIASGYMIQAEKHIDDSFKLIFGRDSALVFLKRLDRYSSITGDYSLYANYSSRLLKKYSNNIEINAINAWANYKNGDIKNSYLTSEKKISKSKYNSIYILLAINNGIDYSNIIFYGKEEPVYFQLLKGSETFSGFADLFGDDRLYVDSALKMLKEGQIQEAYSEITKSVSNDYDKLKMFIAYDSADYKKAADFFIDMLSSDAHLSTEDLLFGCDIMLKNNLDDIASDLYIKIIEESPDFSWLPYRNLYSLNKNTKNGIDILSKGLKIFPDNTELKMSTAWVYYLDNDTEQVNYLLDDLSDKNNISELLKIHLIDGGRSPEYITGNFWTIYNQDPSSVPVAESFAEYLLKNRLFNQFDVLMKKYLHNIGPTVNCYNFLAASYSMRGLNEKGIELLYSADQIEIDMMTSYNRGVLYALSGNYQKALDSFYSIINKNDKFFQNPEYQGKIYFKTAETLYNKREFEESLNYIMKAQNVMPDDLKSTLLLKKIRQEIYD